MKGKIAVVIITLCFVATSYGQFASADPCNDESVHPNNIAEVPDVFPDIQTALYLSGKNTVRIAPGIYTVPAIEWGVGLYRTICAKQKGTVILKPYQGTNLVIGMSAFHPTHFGVLRIQNLTFISEMESQPNFLSPIINQSLGGELVIENSTFYFKDIAISSHNPLGLTVRDSSFIGPGRNTNAVGVSVQGFGRFIVESGGVPIIYPQNVKIESNHFLRLGFGVDAQFGGDIVGLCEQTGLRRTQPRLCRESNQFSSVRTPINYSPLVN